MHYSNSQHSGMLKLNLRADLMLTVIGFLGACSLTNLIRTGDQVRALPSHKEEKA